MRTPESVLEMRLPAAGATRAGWSRSPHRDRGKLRGHRRRPGGSLRFPGRPAYQRSVARAATPWFTPPASGLSRRCASMPSSKFSGPPSSTPSP